MKMQAKIIFTGTVHEVLMLDLQQGYAELSGCTHPVMLTDLDIVGWSKEVEVVEEEVVISKEEELIQDTVKYLTPEIITHMVKHKNENLTSYVTIDACGSVFLHMLRESQKLVQTEYGDWVVLYPNGNKVSPTVEDQAKIFFLARSYENMDYYDTSKLIHKIRD